MKRKGEGGCHDDANLNETVPLRDCRFNWVSPAEERVDWVEGSDSQRSLAAPASTSLTSRLAVQL